MVLEQLETFSPQSDITRVEFAAILLRTLGISSSLQKTKVLILGELGIPPEVWRTAVNTECNYLLLKYAFEELECRSNGWGQKGRDFKKEI